MTDRSDTEQPDRVDAVSAVAPLLREPDSVADAVDVDLRLGALGDWLKERRDYVRGWLLAHARDRRDEDGAAPTWRIDGATVSLTDPHPKPYVADDDAFGRWYAARQGVDPDDVDVLPGGLAHLTDDVAVRAAVTASDAALSAFVGAMQAIDPLDRDGVARVAETFRSRVTVERRVVVSQGLLDRLIDANEAVVAGTDDGGYCVVAGGSGEVIPGVSVRPPGESTIQIRPSQAVRGSVRRELDAALDLPSTVDRA